MTNEEEKMQENKAIIDLTLEEALTSLSRTLYDRNVDMRVIMARQELISVIERKTRYLQDLLEKAYKHLIHMDRIFDDVEDSRNNFMKIRKELEAVLEERK